eukprot:EG_transcript_8169
MRPLIGVAIDRAGGHHWSAACGAAVLLLCLTQWPGGLQLFTLRGNGLGTYRSFAPPSWSPRFPTRIEIQAASRDSNSWTAGSRSRRKGDSDEHRNERVRPGLVRELLQRAQRGGSSASMSSAFQAVQRLDWSRLQPSPTDEQQVREEVGQLLAEVQKVGAKLDPLDAFQALHSLAKLQQQRGFISLRLSAEVLQLAAVLVAHFSTPSGCRGLDGRQASTVIWAIAKLGVPQAREPLVCLCQHMMEPRVLSSLSHINIVMAIYGLGKSRVLYEPFLRAMSSALLNGGHLSSLDGRGVANLAWGCAALGYRDAALMQAVVERVVHVDDGVLPTMNSQNVANTAWAFATLGIRNEALMEKLMGRVVGADGVLPTMNSQNVAITAWAFATLGIRNEALMEKLTGRVVGAGGVLSTMNAQDVTNMAWAFATLGIRIDALMEKLVGRVVGVGGVLPTMNVQNVANMAWAFATLGIRIDALMEKLVGRVVGVGGVLPTMNAQDVANTACAFATLGIRNEALMEKLMGRIVGVGGVLPTMNAQDVANTAWAFATLGIRNEALMEKLMGRVV